METEGRHKLFGRIYPAEGWKIVVIEFSNIFSEAGLP